MSAAEFEPHRARNTTADFSATELLAAYRAGELSPVEAVKDTLQRIETADGALNAFCLVDQESALANARESERRWHRGEPAGKLDGVPVSVKDIFLTKGWPTLRGSRTVDPDQRWIQNGPPVARMREHGAVIVGKTTTPELAWKGVTDNPVDGITRNPWDTSKTPGGSSGGAAAAVAAGMAPLAIGTDGGGSVRIPASFTSTFTIKPTYGRIPHYPASPFGTLAHAGPITNTVSDTALLLDVISGFDSRDWSALAPPETSYLDTLRQTPERLDGMRVAFSPTLGFVRVEPEVARVVADAVGVFAELGAEITETDPGFDDPVEDFHILWFAGVAKSIDSFSAQQRELLDPGLLEVAELGIQYSAMDYLEATARRMSLGYTMGAFHETYDLLLTPTVAVPPFEAGHEVPPNSPHRRWTSWTPFSYPFNMTQQPAASTPCGFTESGLPVGLQVVGPRHADQRVLQACRAFERAQPWAHRRPKLPGE